MVEPVEFSLLCFYGSTAVKPELMSYILVFPSSFKEVVIP